jgi:CubicO group peptidase (beta-lactamase class C family)
MLAVEARATGGDRREVGDPSCAASKSSSPATPDQRSTLPQVRPPLNALAIALSAASLLECTSPGTPTDTVCYDAQCVSLSAVSANISAALDGKVVGYVSYIGTSDGDFGAGGNARTSADGPAVAFSPETKIHVASVSKTVTALAAMTILAKHDIALSSPIGAYLPPDWNLAPDVAAITFEQLLSHTSGIHDSGNAARRRLRRAATEVRLRARRPDPHRVQTPRGHRRQHVLRFLVSIPRYLERL